MRPSDKIENAIRKLQDNTTKQLDDRTLTDSFAVLNKTSKTHSAVKTQNLWRIIMESRTAKYVAATAAVIIVAVLIGVKVFSVLDKDNARMSVEQQDITPQKNVVGMPKEAEPGQEKKIEVTSAADKLEEELRDVQQMFAAGNIAGLVDMLDKGQWETKVAAANYLAKIGDISAIGALEKLNEEWVGDTQDSPFAVAIGTIRNRTAEDSKVVNTTDNVVVVVQTDSNTFPPSDIHIVTKRIWSDGKIDEEKDWLKDEVMLRKEEPDEVIIDNGVDRLVLDKEKRTAQLSDSLSPFENYMEHGQFEIVSAFIGYESTPYKIAELPDESDGNGPVYEVVYRDIYKAKAWVNTQSNLPIRLVINNIEDDRERHVVKAEIFFNYDPIPLEKFKITVPSGYEELEPIKSPTISGFVIDEYGEPVVGASVYTSKNELWARTNKNGEFLIELRPNSYLYDLPLFIRAFESNNPNHVAWTLLQSPKNETRPLYIPDDGKTKHVRGGNIDITFMDPNELAALIPGEPGDAIFRKETDSSPSAITNIVLEMAPGSIISGLVKNHIGEPIAGAIIWMDHIKLQLGANEIDIQSLGCPDKDQDIISSPEFNWKTFTVTDTNGYYEFSNLPKEWSEIRLETKAASYTTEAKTIYEEQYCDFELLEADITIRGIVIDHLGEPLVGREVGIDIDEDYEDDREFNIKDAVTDVNGIFELANIPAVSGLELEIRTDERPYDWDENELTKDREFVYYLMIEEPIHFVPGKKDYWVEIVPHRPDITIEVEVKNSRGDLLENIPVGVCSPGFSERLWYSTKLIGMTNEYGLCTIAEVPEIHPLNLWICHPNSRIDLKRDLSQEYAAAVAESQEYYSPMNVLIELEQNRTEYWVSVTLSTIEEYREK